MVSFLKNILAKSYFIACSQFHDRVNASRAKYFNDCIFLVSYPKSGNTWLRFLVGNYLTENRCDFNNCQSIIPDIHFDPNIWKTSLTKPPKFIKSHLPFTENYNKVIYLVRDGRDVAVSYYFYLLKYKKIDKDTNFTEFIKQFNAGQIDDYFSWSQHIQSWIDRKSDNILIIKYEDLIIDTYSELIKILNFSEISVDRSSAMAAVESSKFERMQQLEKQQHDTYAGFSSSDPKLRFIRSGKVGCYLDFFENDTMADFIKVHGSTLKYFNYL